MQIITGKYKGRKLVSLDTEKTRPTLARVKESIFAFVRDEIENSIVLDLFAGSGAMGIEAISEGAKKVYFVDNNKDAKKIISKNLINVKEDYEIKIADYLDALKEFKNRNLLFDLVFLDPPYKSDYGEKAISMLKDLKLLKNNAIIVFEQTTENCLQNPLNGFIIEKSRKYGIVNVSILKNIEDWYGYYSINWRIRRWVLSR